MKFSSAIDFYVLLQEDIISIWNRTSSDQQVTSRIRDTLRRVLNLPANTMMEYKTHNTSLKFVYLFFCRSCNRPVVTSLIAPLMAAYVHNISTIKPANEKYKVASDSHLNVARRSMFLGYILKNLLNNNSPSFLILHQSGAT